MASLDERIKAILSKHRGVLDKLAGKGRKVVGVCKDCGHEIDEWDVEEGRPHICPPMPMSETHVGAAPMPECPQCHDPLDVNPGEATHDFLIPQLRNLAHLNPHAIEVTEKAADRLESLQARVKELEAELKSRGQEALKAWAEVRSQATLLDEIEAWAEHNQARHAERMETATHAEDRHDHEVALRVVNSLAAILAKRVKP